MNLDRWTSSIATQLRAVVEANPEMSFYSFSSPLTEEDRREGEKFWNLPQVRKVTKANFLLRNYDIVQVANMSKASLLCAQLCKWRSLGKTQIVGITCVEVHQDDPVIWQSFIDSEKVVDQFLSVSYVAGSKAREECPERYYGVIHNGYASKYYDPSDESMDQLPDSVKALGSKNFHVWVSSIEPRKRPEFLVRLAQKHPELNFVAAGYLCDGNDHFLEAIKAEKNILWLGLVSRETVKQLYKHACSLVFTSIREGLPLTVLEAAGMGLPVIAQPRSSMPEIVKDDLTGWVIDESNEDAWSERLRSCQAMSSEERAAWAEKASSYVRKHYDWGMVGKKYGAFYKLVMKGEEDRWRREGDVEIA